MKNIARIMKLLSDATRLRILTLLMRRELCVCQIMGVVGISQPLVSRNLNILSRAGFLEERKEGKLVFYSLNRKMNAVHAKVIDLISDLTGNNRELAEDLKSLRDCEDFMKKTGKCDLKTFSEFMAHRRKGRRGTGLRHGS
jgi:ArsR family transcriptional regulator